MNEVREQDSIPPEEKPPQVQVVTLLPDDWQVLRDLKLRSIEQEPIAFEDPAVGREKYLDRTEQEWRALLEGRLSGGRAGESIMVFARDETTEVYVGMVTAIIPAQESTKKTATVQHMYVDQEGFRRRGVGKSLLQSLLDRLQARGDVQRVELQVVETQEAAIGLYQRMGFKEYGRIQGGAQRGEESYDEIEMALEF